MPGGAKSPTVNVPSLNSGRNELPNVDASQRDSAVATAADDYDAAQTDHRSAVLHLLRELLAAAPDADARFKQASFLFSRGLFVALSELRTDDDVVLDPG